MKSGAGIERGPLIGEIDGTVSDFLNDFQSFAKD
jgi:hypothetical protein